MNMKEMRSKTGLSQAKFARRYNIPVRTIEDWESGKRKPPAYVEELLLRAVNEDVYYDGLSLKKTASLDLGEGFCTEEYKSDDYEVTVNSSGNVKSITARPLKSYMPEISLSNGEVTRIGFIGDVILEESIDLYADALRIAKRIIEELKKL